MEVIRVPSKNDFSLIMASCSYGFEIELLLTFSDHLDNFVAFVPTGQVTNLSLIIHLYKCTLLGDDIAI